MDESKWPINQQLTEYVRGECLRQLSMMDLTASSLSTKASLYMVFAAFTFGVELQLAHNAEWAVSSSLSGVAMIFCLVAVLCLLRSSSLREWGMPPRAAAFQQESAFRFTQLLNSGKSEEDALLVLQEKYINSLTRSVEKNHDANMKTVKMLGWASTLLLLSVICLLSSAVLAFAPSVWRAVHL
jgi:hypothetical protein